MESTNSHHALRAATPLPRRHSNRHVSAVIREKRSEKLLGCVSDALTGVLGAGPFHDALSKMLQRCCGRRREFAMMLVAIDDLRTVNYEFGHVAGDRVLAHVAHLIGLSARSSDIVGRLGGNSFAIAMPNCGADEARCRATALTDRVRRNPLHVAEHNIGLTVGIGITHVCPARGEQAGHLIASVSAALADARHRGPGMIGSVGSADERLDIEPSSIQTADYNRLSRRVLELQRLLKSRQLEQIMSLVAAIEAKDPCAESHSINVALYAVQLAAALKLPEVATDLISTAALLHDVGKIGIPDAILTKPGRLTPAEYDRVKEHPEIGVDILQRSPSLRSALPFILYHHEWYNGRGYPRGLAGERIPLGARIIQTADCIDAMQSTRTYKSGYGLDRVLSELRRGRGTQFDPAIADAAIAHLSSNAPEPTTPWSSLDLRAAGGPSAGGPPATR